MLKQRGTSMAEDGEDWNGLEMTILKSLAHFSQYTNGDVAPLSIIFYLKSKSFLLYVVQPKRLENQQWLLRHGQLLFLRLYSIKL